MQVKNTVQRIVNATVKKKWPRDFWNEMLQFKNANSKHKQYIPF